MFKTFSFRKFDYFLVLILLIQNVIGIMAIGSARPDMQIRQIQGMIFGIVIMVLVSMFDYRKLLRAYWLYYVLCILLLLMVIFNGQDGGGAKRWIQLGGITFQPSEAAKILLILFYSAFIMKYEERIKNKGFLVLCTALIVPPVLLIYKQPDLSTSIMILLIFLSLFFVAGLDKKIVLGGLLASVPLAALLMFAVLQESSALLNPYQQRRILAWLHPEDYADTIAYQTMNSITAIGSGQLFGKGYNTNEISSLLNSGFISESQTDFIFTVISEEFGFIGSCSVVILLTLITLKCFQNARTAKDRSGQLLCAGIASWIGFQGFINIGVATGVLINTGLPLPFVSYGLTSLLSLYIGMGFVLNVHMQSGISKNATMVTRINGYVIPETREFHYKDPFEK